ncbi:MAG: hypothetical protein AAFP69_04850, partial [Planctomycetota bacterium]
MKAFLISQVFLCTLWISGTAAAEEGLVKRLSSEFGSLAWGGDETPVANAENDLWDAELTKEQADTITNLLWDARRAWLRKSRAAEFQARVVSQGSLKMRYDLRRFGKPRDNDMRSLFISMHGGGGAPARVNDQQWENQKRLYAPAEGIYVAPRAPTNTWNLWHQSHIDPMFAQLISDLVLFENVDPDRVYLMGYSAGGDGVFQLAPRMADRWAAVAMMAGHPNESSPLGLRNVPFALQMGGKDAAYNRNKIASQWKTKLKELQTNDPGGYDHFVRIYPQYGHWMQREDRVAIPWMMQRNRNTRPKRIVWKQDDV